MSEDLESDLVGYDLIENELDEIDFLTGIAPSCNLEEGCESCT